MALPGEKYDWVEHVESCSMQIHSLTGGALALRTEAVLSVECLHQISRYGCLTAQDRGHEHTCEMNA